MPDLASFVDWVVARATAYARDITASSAVGFLSVCIASLIEVNGKNPVPETAAFGFGFLVTLAILSYCLASPSRFIETMKQLKEAHQRGDIPEEQFNLIAQRAAAWFAARNFGGPPPPK